MSSFGLDRFTGKPISGWAHVLQSVDVIFETEIGDRVMLRHFGGGMRRLLGRRLTQRVLALAAAVFSLSIAIWEPRLRVVRVVIAPSAEEIRQGTGLPPEKWSSLMYGLGPFGGCFYGTEESYG